MVEDVENVRVVAEERGWASVEVEPLGEAREELERNGGRIGA